MALRCLWCKSVHSKTRLLIREGAALRLRLYPLANKATAAVSQSIAPEENVTRGVEHKETSTHHENHGHPDVDLTFTNCKEAYRSKTTAELLRAYFVFQITSIPVIVNNSKSLMNMLKSVVGRNLFKKIMQATFYGHFVAGEDRVGIQPVVNRNRMFGVKSILDYSAEKDVSTEQAKEATMKATLPDKVLTEIAKDSEHERFQVHEEFGDRSEGVVSSRVYYYEGEEQCDRNMEIFLESIDGVADATKKTGFCAIKLTALGRPQLLLQMSDVLVSARNFFESLTGIEEGDNFSRGFREDEFLLKLHDKGVKIDAEEASRWFSILDMTRDGQVDIMDWDNLLEVNMRLDELLVVPNTETGELLPLIHRLPLHVEYEMKNMLHRINRIAEYAVERDVRVMVDAEHTYFQPAINRLTIELMKKFNKEKAFIYNTYQCYLTSAYKTLRLDLDTAMRHNVYFGAKLVRGAYMEQERERAAAIGYEDPINPTFEATTEMYNKVLREMMMQMKMCERGRISVMVATHNEDTVRYAVEKMKEYGIKPEDRVVCFGQLLGMCDQVSFPLGQAGYSVYKYVPYGPVEEVMPYLSRRTQENRGILKKVKKEKTLLRSEILRRVRSGELNYDPLKHLPNIPPI